MKTSRSAGSIPPSGPSAIVTGDRIGTPAITTQGMREEQMATIGGLIHRVLVGREDEGELAAVRTEILELCVQFKPY